MRLDNYKIAVVDTETTGLDPNKHEIIEIAAVIYNQLTDEIEDQWEAKIRPTRLEIASEKALEINGFRKNAHLYVNDRKDVMTTFSEKVKGCYILGQNTQFDLGFIYSALNEANIYPSFQPRRYLDTMILAYPYLKNKEIKGLSLQYLCEYFDVSNDGAHTALIDCLRTLEVFKKLMKIYDGT